ncbi:MAG: hypothetical protein IT306_28595 [Chloroflexi bacterium]|nr:hypothetical protein [Chloroflexota bacterium]
MSEQPATVTTGHASLADEPPPGPTAATGPGPWRCLRDPGVETYLRCGRCETPICPRCLIQTPVGSRCRDCAQLRRLPMFEVRPVHYLRGLAAGLAAGVAAGLVMVLLQTNIRLFGIFGLLMVAAVGYLVGEAMSRGTRGKRGLPLAILAALCVPLGLIGGWTVYLMTLGAAPPAALMFATVQVFGTSLWGLLSIGFGAAIAFYRVR